MIVTEQRYAPALHGFLGAFGFLLLALQHLSSFTLKIGNAYPQLLLTFVLVIACLLGEWVGFWYGFAFGLALDTMAGRSAVFNTLAFMIVAVLAGLLYRYFLNKNIKAVFLGSLAFALLYYLFKWLILYCLRGEPSAFTLLLHYFLPSAVYTAFTVLPFYYAVRRLARHYALG